ncbi:MAG: carboxymuconolactone decarboxylase family protein [Geminicoccaceae bacterium]
MSIDFTLHTPETAPEASKGKLDEAKKAFGFVPNLHAELAEAPAALAGYSAIWDSFGTSSLSPVEQQLVYLTANYENECRYCMAGHSVLAKMVGMPPEVIEALREGRPVPDAKLEALRRFTSAMVVKRGWVEDSDIAAFQAAGYGRQQILEVILGIAVKTISNYTNHVAATPLDAFMADTVWEPPAKRRAAA